MRDHLLSNRPGADKIRREPDRHLRLRRARAASVRLRCLIGGLAVACICGQALIALLNLDRV
ncbi:hypothetical protein HSX11_23895 [Oxalobacteraceae bacterium]|nr:hypothetical protein [Oxalobacteraceae bacterium]